MNADRAAGPAPASLIDVPASVARVKWATRLGLAGAGLACLAAMLLANPLLAPDEARHAGIVHDMWAARQYVVPRVNGLPVLDGAPLYYWLAVGFVSLFGLHEWTLRIPSALSALLALWVMARLLSVRHGKCSFMTVLALGLVQPALIVAGRLAAPDMLSLCLLTIAVGCFARAAIDVEDGFRPRGWVTGAWAASALLALSAGPLGLVIPAALLFLWLALRRRPGLWRGLWSWPGLFAAGAIVLPWWALVSAKYPGVLPAMLERQAAAMFREQAIDWAAPWAEPGGLLMLAALVPVAACLYRLRRPATVAGVRSPLTGLMAVWLVASLPLYPVLTMTRAGAALTMAMPLLYLGSLALTFDGAAGWRRVRACGLYLALAFLAVVTALHHFTSQASAVVPLTQVMKARYLPAVDKVIMLDRYDHEFSFYMRSPKLVFVATDWESSAPAVSTAWRHELRDSARFAPETAKRMLLTYDGFRERICERRAVNLWIVATEAAARQHAVLDDVNPIEGTGSLHAWYLPAESTPRQC